MALRVGGGTHAPARLWRATFETQSEFFRKESTENSSKLKRMNFSRNEKLEKLKITKNHSFYLNYHAHWVVFYLMGFIFSFFLITVKIY